MSKTSEAYREYRIRVLEMQTKYPEFRIGQCLYNALYDNNPELAEKVNGTELDPFYTKDKQVLTNFISWVYKELSE